MRVFIAIDIDEQTLRALKELQSQLQDKADIKKGDVKWVRPELIHLTLKFLGEIKDKEILEVCTIIENVASRHSAFDLDIESVGHFGGRNARLLWVGTGQGKEQLKQLHEDIEEQLAHAGWPKENREFTGHMTLCRIKNTKAGSKMAQLSQEYKEYEIGTTPVDSVVVYESQLTPSGPIYTALGTYKLKTEKESN
jgi:2'-5' RNA ligase